MLTMNTTSLQIVIRPAQFSEIFRLRKEVLYAYDKAASARFPTDKASSTLHFAAYAGGVVGCASFSRDPVEGRPAWRLRGMAVHAQYRSLGIGRQILQFTETYLILKENASLLWCTARPEAATFYTKQNWQRTTGTPAMGTACVEFTKKLAGLIPSA